jgi:hypothetical protein
MRERKDEEWTPAWFRRAADRRRSARVLALLGALLVASCGGGGGGGGGPPPLSMALSTTSMTFTSTDGGTPLGQPVTATFSGSGSGTLYIVLTPADPTLVSITNPVVTGKTSGQATITPASATSVGIGSHATTVSVQACLNDATCQTGQISGSPQTISVTYSVDGISASLANLTYDIGNNATAASYTQSFNVTGYPATQSWTAGVSNTAPWLSVTPSSGATGNSVAVTATLDQAQVNALDNGVYAGSVYLTPANGSQVTLPVTLTVSVTRVDFVAPYVVSPGSSDAVIIRGEHFDAIPSGALSVDFGPTPAASATLVSATEIHATLPMLTAGRYPVTVLSSGQAAGTTRATLVVVAPPAFPAATIAYPAGNLPVVRALAYDAERQALYAQFWFNSNPPPAYITYSLARYGYAGGAWSAPTTTSLGRVSTFALSTDGTQLLWAYFDTAFNGMSVTPLDPVTLQPVGAATNNNASYALGAQSMGVANNGQAIIMTAPGISGDNLPVLAYSELHPALTPLLSPGIPPVQAAVGASGDGARTYLASDAIVSGGGPPPVQFYDASSGQLTATTSALLSPSISVDEHGTRVLLNAKDVYDGSITLLGSLPVSTLASVVAPDARRAYAYDSNGTVRVFDLTAAPVGGLFPEVLPAKSLSGAPPASAWAVFAISPDGGTLFVAIDGGIYVVPLP